LPKIVSAHRTQPDSFELRLRATTEATTVDTKNIQNSSLAVPSECAGSHLPSPWRVAILHNSPNDSPNNSRKNEEAARQLGGLLFKGE